MAGVDRVHPSSAGVQKRTRETACGGAEVERDALVDPHVEHCERCAELRLPTERVMCNERERRVGAYERSRIGPGGSVDGHKSAAHRRCGVELRERLRDQPVQRAQAHTTLAGQGMPPFRCLRDRHRKEATARRQSRRDLHVYT